MKTDNKAAISFLKKWNPKGPWVLTAIQIDKKAIVTKTFGPNSTKSLTKWLEEYNGTRNIYFHVNSTIKDMNIKAHKEDVKSGDWLHIDIDPEEGHDIQDEQERALSLLTNKLPKGISEPTVIIFSGGGYQGFWKLKEPVVVDGNLEKCQDFERYNKRLEHIFSGDHCHNIDRIMRLPGTINVPNAKKKKAGRVPTLAVLLEFNKKSYDIKEFKKSQPVQMKSTDIHDGGGYGVKVNISGNIKPILDLSELDEWSVPDRVKVIIAQGKHPEQPKEGDNSRSAWLFDCVCQLVRCNVPDEIIFAILMDPEWSISESILEANPNSEKYAIRQIKRAKENAEDPHLRRMNERHAVIGNIGGKCRVIEEVEDDILNRSRLTISSFEDVRNRYGHIKVQVAVDKDNKPVFIPLGKYWLGHAMRRQFDYIRFMPQGDKEGVYNLWRGFSFSPVPGDCSLFLEHLKENVCGGVEEYYDYFLKWMARGIQTPASPGEVAIVLRGGKGVGKGTISKHYGKLFGRHYLQVANPSHLVGNFNAHLRDVIFLFADEAFFAGDKKHESVLKMLVTEDSIAIEAKGVDIESYPNYVHLIMASNDPHVIRASGDERRYFVLEVGATKRRNTRYFKAIQNQMEDGGYEALLYLLQELNLEGFEVRNAPETGALQEQKLLSLNIDEEWWYRKLQNGRIIESDSDWKAEVTCDRVISDFTAYAEKWKFNRRGNETSLGRFLSRVCPHIKRTQCRITVDDYNEEGRPIRKKKRMYVYDFGSLEDCRKTWEDIHGKTIWDKDLKMKLEQPPANVF